MKCESVLKELSCFVDDAVDRDRAGQISRHLNQCGGCRREFNRLLELRRKLGTLENIEPPEYLKHLVELRVNTSSRETWRERLRNSLEYSWSKVRTTESMWYFTRLLGTVTTFVFFFAKQGGMAGLSKISRCR